jgi:DtxR family Mn-dependent transcriptional regulator
MMEDALKHLHDMAQRGHASSVESLAGALEVSLKQAGQVLELLERSGLARREGVALVMTNQGRQYAAHVVRAHRLYETYLARIRGTPADRWHEQAERQEHRLSRSEVDELARALGDPRYDPHGDPIPTPHGETPSLRGFSLLDAPPGWQGRIVHVEDEPADVFHKLAGLNLAPGVQIEVRRSGGDRIVLEVHGVVSDLTRAMAANLRVEPLGEGEVLDKSLEPLSNLAEGEVAEIAGLTPACMGPERNRLLDLGVVPGTEVALDLTSASGSPTAYRIRGASIALRREQARRILIRRKPTPEHAAS